MASKIIDNFVSSVDRDRTDYTLDDLKKLLSEAYKTSKAKKKRTSTEKKEPSKYNIFIKEEIAKIRQENPEADNKKLMSLAAARWKDHKEKIATTSQSGSDTSSLSLE
jgi:YABBY protein